MVLRFFFLKTERSSVGLEHIMEGEFKMMRLMRLER